MKIDIKANYMIQKLEEFETECRKKLNTESLNKESQDLLQIINDILISGFILK